MTVELPNVGAILAPLLQRVPPAEQPLLIALAERMAADRYRGWASDSPDPARAARLRACAEREDEIARRIETLYPETPRAQRDLLAKHPDLADANRALFAGRPVAEQFAIQAQGERLGAATWRSFAKQRPEARDTFLACATLEEESAAVLEAILREIGR